MSLYHFHADKIRRIKTTELTAGVWSSTICSLGIHVAFTRLPLQQQNKTDNLRMPYVTTKGWTVPFDSQPLHSLLWHEAPVFVQTLLQPPSLFLRVVGEEVLLSSDWDFMSPGASCEQLTGAAESKTTNHNKSQQKDKNKMIRAYVTGSFQSKLKSWPSKQTARSVTHTSWILQTWKVLSYFNKKY